MKIHSSFDERWKSFMPQAEIFLNNTEQYTLDGINPGGYYKDIWCRDASYILKDCFLSGSIYEVLKNIEYIWAHQISCDEEKKIVYGRGSPKTKFLRVSADSHNEIAFQGSLPTTIYKAGFCEIYGQNPDIDSTALMVSTTSWILLRILEKWNLSSKRFYIANDITTTTAEFRLSSSSTSAKLIDFLVPRMLRAVEFLGSRDIDGDGLLEQGYNEDWMDTALRTGKTVYSQATWILALKNLYALLLGLSKDSEIEKLRKLANKAIHAIECNLWSEEISSYLDNNIQTDCNNGESNKIFTQDISLYLVAITENTTHDLLNLDKETNGSWPSEILGQNHLGRANKTLDAMRNKLWKNRWPCITEVELKRTGPWFLNPYQYHNHTFWPWITAIEIHARSRLNRIEECCKLISEKEILPHSLYEWVHPINGIGNGARPFRTGISAMRIAIIDIFGKICKESEPSDT